MGYDPFWPISLATINVLVVPASPISPSRFNEIFLALKKVSSVDLRDVDLEGIESDLIFSVKPNDGSILVNYSTSLRQSSIQRFPLELNADPQVVLGIYEASDSTGPQIQEEGSNGQSNDIHNVLSKFRSHFDHHQNGCTSNTAGIRQESPSGV